MFSEHDVIKQLMQLFAEIIRRALRLAKDGKKDEAVQLLRAQTGEHFGIEFEVLEMLDPASALKLLGQRQRIDAYLEVLRGLAEIEAEPWKTRLEDVTAAAKAVSRTR